MRNVFIAAVISAMVTGGVYLATVTRKLLRAQIKALLEGIRQVEQQIADG